MKKLLITLSSALTQAQEAGDSSSVIVLNALIGSIAVGHQPILAQSVGDIVKQKLMPALIESNIASQN
jgi:hypothetical protein